MQYYHKVVNLLSTFKVATIEHIRREQNLRANSLSKLTSTKNKNHYDSVVQMIVLVLSISIGEEVMVVEEGKECWTTSSLSS